MSVSSFPSNQRSKFRPSPQQAEDVKRISLLEYSNYGHGIGKNLDEAAYEKLQKKHAPLLQNIPHTYFRDKCNTLRSASKYINLDANSGAQPKLDAGLKRFKLNDGSPAILEQDPYNKTEDWVFSNAEAIILSALQDSPYHDMIQNFLQMRALSRVEDQDY